MIPLFSVDHLEPTQRYLRVHNPHSENHRCGLSWFRLRGQIFFQTEHVELDRCGSLPDRKDLVALLGSRVFETTHWDWTLGNISLCFNKFDHLMYLIYVCVSVVVIKTDNNSHRHDKRNSNLIRSSPQLLHEGFSNGLKDSPTNPCPGWEECTLWRGLHSALTEDLYPSNRPPSSCAAVHRG